MLELTGIRFACSKSKEPGIEDFSHIINLQVARIKHLLTYCKAKQIGELLPGFLHNEPPLAEWKPKVVADQDLSLKTLGFFRPAGHPVSAQCQFSPQPNIWGLTRNGAWVVILLEGKLDPERDILPELEELRSVEIRNTSPTELWEKYGINPKFLFELMRTVLSDRKSWLNSQHSTIEEIMTMNELETQLIFGRGLN